MACKGILSAPFPEVITLSATANGAHSVTTADLDRDGDLDVIAGAREDGQIVWHQNLGGQPARFAPQVIATASGTYMVAPADLNHDGRVDIVVAAVGILAPAAASADAETAVAGTGAVFWLQNNLPASPAFIRRDIAVNLNYPVAVDTADLNYDGALDVVVATRDDNSVTWYENRKGSLPTFAPHLVTAQVAGAVAVDVADVDGDGKLDILVASENDNRILWYRHNGAVPPAFDARVVRSGPPPPAGQDYAKAVFGADIDGDGDTDIAYASEQENQIGWYENQNRGAVFVPHVLASDADHAKFVTVADVDLDGDMDILAASAYDNKVVWYANSGAAAPSFVAYVVSSTAVGARSVHAADVDGDGDIDLLSASRDDDRVLLYPNNTTHRTAILNAQTEYLVRAYYGARSVFAADIDRDGDMDVLSTAREVASWDENIGGSPPSFVSHLIDNTLEAGRWMYAADLDGDGDPDPVVADTKSSNITWYENLLSQPGVPPTFIRRVVSREAIGPRTVMAADLDSDGDLDLYSASDGDNAVTWFENMGGRPLVFARHVVTFEAMYARSAYAADLDGDGDLDLMSASAADSIVAWYENQGGVPLKWVRRPITNGLNGVRHVHADDMDGDGDIDLVTASEYDNAITWIENRGGNPLSFVVHFVTRGAAAAHAVITGDADQDGDIDIFAANEGNNTIAWYENDGAALPSFTERVIVNTARVAHGIYVADVDGDGDLDALSASRDDGKIAWYENRGGQYSLVNSPVAATSASQVTANLAITHKGRPGNAAVELNALNLRFTNASGQPLTPTQIRALFSTVSVYRDRGNNVLEPGQDALLARVDTFAFDTGGQLYVPLPDDHPNVQTSAGATDHYFVVADKRSGTTCAISGSIHITNHTNGGTARNAVTSLPLLAEFMRSLDAPVGPEAIGKPLVVFNELMSDNTKTLLDPDEPGEYPDWIELHNPSSLPVNLGGRYLTDDLTDPQKFRIKDGIILPANGYLVFIADGEPEQGPLHLNFRLSQNGESVSLLDTASDGFRPLSEVTFGPLAADVAYGRFPNGTGDWQNLGLATPGANNLNEPFVINAWLYLPLIMNSPGC